MPTAICFSILSTPLYVWNKTGCLIMVEISEILYRGLLIIYSFPSLWEPCHDQEVLLEGKLRQQDIITLVRKLFQWNK